MGALRIMKPKTDTVEQLEAELAKLNAEGAATAGQIEDLEAKESTIEDPDQLLTVVAAKRAAQNKVARIDRDIAVVRERLATAKDARRAKLRAELLAAFDPAARDFLKSARSTLAVLDRLIAAQEAIEAAGFVADHRQLAQPPRVGGGVLIAPDLLDRFEAAMSQDTPLQVAKIAPRDAPYVFAPALPEPVVTKPAAQPAPPAPPAPRPPRAKRSPLRETATEGQRLVYIMRSGIDDSERGQLQVGDVIATTPTHAEALLRSTAGDFITAESVAEMDAAVTTTIAAGAAVQV